MPGRDLFGRKRQETYSNLSHPIYCLKEPCIEKYLDPKFNCSNLPQEYNKKTNGPEIAESSKIHDEIAQLFDVIIDDSK
jgi:hypothetical protein